MNGYSPMSRTGRGNGRGHCRTAMTPEMRLLNDVFGSTEPERNPDYESSFPPANIYKDEDSKELVFEFAVAGYDPKEITVSFEEDHMFVERVEAEDVEEEERTLSFLKHKIAQRDFKLQYKLAVYKLETAKATATHKNGILKIVIPQSEDAKPKSLEIDIIN